MRNACHMRLPATLRLLLVAMVYCISNNMCLAQAEYWGISAGMAIRTRILTDNPPVQDVRIFYSTTATDSIAWYSLVGLDCSLSQWAPVLTLQFGHNSSIDGNINFRPNIGIGGIKFGPSSGGPLSVFNIYMGVCVESQVLDLTILGISYEQRLFVPYMLQVDQPDVSLYARFRL